MKTTRLRKALSILLSLALVVGFLPVYTIQFAPHAFAVSNQCGDSVTFSYDSTQTVLTITGTGAMWDFGTVANGSSYISAANYNALWNKIKTINISSGITRIGDNAFRGFLYLETVSMPTTVTSIGDHAFSSCTHLSSVDLSHVQTIEDYAFSYVDNNLQSVDLTSAQTIGAYAFDSCTSLTSVSLSGSLRTIGAYAFEKCGLTSLNTGAGLTSIGDYAFNDCRNLTNVVIGRSVETIGEKAFYYCSSLQTVNAANNTSLRSIGESAFAFCSSLTSTSGLMRSTVTSIGASAFSNCNSLTYFNLHESRIASVADNLFYSCSSLSSITLPNTVTSIGEKAFYLCSSLTSANIPRYCTSIGLYAFYGCTALVSLDVAAENLTDMNGKYAFNQAGQASTGIDVTFRSTVTRVPAYMFYESSSGAYPKIKSVYFEENGVTSIGDSAFWYVSALESVVFPSSLTSIGINAFSNCPDLKSINIPKNVTSIGKRAFSGCSKLESVEYAAVNMTDFDNNSSLFSGSGNGTANGFALTVCSTVRRIPAYMFHSANISSAMMENGVTEISDHAFYYSNVKSINLPVSVTTLGSYAFAGCYYLESLDVACANLSDLSADSNVFQSIGNSATDGTAVTFRGSVEKIPDNMFNVSAYNPNIRSVDIKDGVKAIGEKAFYRCSMLTTVTIPYSVESIGDSAFESCNALLELDYRATNVPDSACGADVFKYAGSSVGGFDVTFGALTQHIPANLFNTASSSSAPTVKTVTFNPNVTCTIGDAAFKNCSTITDVYVNGTPQDWSTVTIGADNDPILNAPYHFDGSAAEAGMCGSSVIWEYDSDTDTLTITGSGAMKDYTVNGSVSTAPWASHTSSLKTVVFGSGITAIGANSFYGCTNLTNVTIPYGMTTVGAGAFAGCTKLELTVPGSVYNVGTNAFLNIPALFFGRNFTEGALIRYSYYEGDLAYAESGFKTLVYCKRSATGAIEIPVSVETIAAEAFKDCTGITSVYIPRRVEAIGARAFFNCTNISVIEYDAILLSSLESSDDVFGKVGVDSGYGVEVVFGEYADHVPAYMFSVTDSQYQPRLLAVTMPDGMISIGAHAFDGCSTLRYIRVPSSVTTVGEGAFFGCSHLASAGPIGEGYDYEFGWSTAIPASAFTGLTSLATATLPNTITSIGVSAFQNCVSLTSVTMSANLDAIGARAFDGCTALTAITIPQYVQTIGARAFADCVSVETVDVYAAELLANEYDDEVFNNLGRDAGGADVTFHSTVTAVPDYMFYGGDPENRPRIKTVTMENGVQTIGESSFLDCVDMTDLILPASLTSIGETAFLMCVGLTSVTIPCSVGYAAFGECFNLQSVEITEGAVSIDEMAFAYDVNLETVTLPASLTTIRESAFLLHVDANLLADIQAAYDEAVAAGQTSIEGVPITVWQMLLQNPNSSLTDVYYGGLQSDWSNISIDTGNDDLLAAQLHAHSHNYTSVTTPATCTQEGSIVYTCECGDTYTETIPKIDHVDSNNDGRCDICGRYQTTSGTFNNTLTWSFDYDTETLTISGTGAIPSYFGGNSNTTPWKNFVNVIKHVVIAEGVTQIGNNAFLSCTEIEDVSIANTVTSLGSGAFKSCSSLTTVSIPDSVTTIGANAFEGCTSLQSISISEYVTSLGNSAFKNCTALTEIYYNSPNILSFSNNAEVFYNAGTAGPGITVTIGSAVQTVPNYLFYTRDSYNTTFRPAVSTLIIEEGCTTIGSNAFYRCERLTTVYLPKSLQTISANAFRYCMPIADVYYAGTQEDWQSVTINSGNDELYASNGAVFHPHVHSYTPVVTVEASCTAEGLMTYTCECGDTYTDVIPKTAHPDANDDGFCDACGHLVVTSGMCGDHVTWSYDEDTKVLTIALDDTNTPDSMYDFNRNTIPWRAAKALIEQVVIQSGVTGIGDYAFYECAALESVSIPNTVTSIGSYVFSYCSALETIVVPSSVTVIGRDTFRNCTSLTSADIPGVDTIESMLFVMCSSLESVTLHEGTTTINGVAFSGCSALTSISLPSTLTTIGSSTFADSGLTSIVIPDSVTDIGILSFKNCTALQTAHLPENVNYKRITNSLFSGCTSLTTVNIPSAVKMINTEAFYNCSSLQSVTIPAPTTSIDVRAFKGCSMLTSVTFQGTDVTSIGLEAFMGCSKLMTFSIPASVTSIGARAFYGCTFLQTGIPSGVTTIADETFYGCKWLSAVIVPDGVTSIGDRAFYNSGVSSVSLPNTLNSIGSQAFAYCPIDYVSVANGNAKYVSMAYCVIERSGNTLVIGSSNSVIPTNGSVTAIGPSAFEGNSQLSEITIPLTVTSIADNAFNDCTNLATVHYAGDQEQWDAIAIGVNNDPLNNAIHDFHVHNYFRQVITEPTCTQEGRYKYLCNVCGKSYIEIVPMLDHTDANHDAICDVCGTDLNDIHPGETVTVNIDAYGTTKLRFIPLVSGQYTIYSTANDNLDPTVVLYGSDDSILASNDDGGEGLNFRLTTNLIMGQTYYFGCSESNGDNAVSYNVTLSLDSRLETLDPVSGKDTVIDTENGVIYGLAPHVTNLSDYVTAKAGYSYTCTGMARDGVYSTGTKLFVYSADTLVAEYTLLVYGDVDGDGWYDGNDAYLVQLIVNGMISQSALTAAQRSACDANRDGSITNADAALLEQAGLLLSSVDQTDNGSLVNNSVYLEYCSLIAQSDDEAVELLVEPAAQPSVLARILNFFRYVYEFLRNLFLVKAA